MLFTIGQMGEAHFILSKHINLREGDRFLVRKHGGE